MQALDGSIAEYVANTAKNENRSDRSPPEVVACHASHLETENCLSLSFSPSLACALSFVACRTYLPLPRPPPRLGHTGVQPRVRTYVLGAAGEGFREGGDDAVYQGQCLLRLSPQQYRDSAGDCEAGPRFFFSSGSGAFTAPNFVVVDGDGGSGRVACLVFGGAGGVVVFFVVVVVVVMVVL